MFKHTRLVEYEVEDGEVLIGEDARFYHCNVSVTIEREACSLTGAADVYGEISFPHPVPKDMFYDKDGIPVAFDVLAENETRKLTIESMLVVSDPDEWNEIEFVACDAEYVIEKETEPEPTAEERAIQLLDDLACKIADGDVKTLNVSRHCEPKNVMGEWFSGPTTLEITYRK